MIRHLCRLAWNRKRGYVLLGLEMLISFLIIAVIVIQALNSLILFKSPLGFDYRDVWWVRLQPRELAQHPDKADDAVVRQEVKSILEGFEEVEVMAAHSTPPFAYFQSQGPGEYSGVKAYFNYSWVSDRLDQVLKLSLVAGRWFSEEDGVSGREPVVVTRKLARTFFGNGDPLGKTIDFYTGEALRVIGVVDHCRYLSPFAAEEPFLYRRVREDRDQPGWFLIRLRPGTLRAFEKQMREALAPVAGQWSVDVETLEGKREYWIGATIKPLVLRAIIAGFMLAIVALGLVGVLWQNVTQRTREIGVRRASGATKGGICAQFVGEILVVATFAAVLGAALLFQFALFDAFPSVTPGVYSFGLLSAAVILYLLVGIAALYPGWLAAQVSPVAALHHE